MDCATMVFLVQLVSAIELPHHLDKAVKILTYLSLLRNEILTLLLPLYSSGIIMEPGYTPAFSS